MAVAKSPFYVAQDFLSPKQCEYLVDSLELFDPDYNADDKPIKRMKYDQDCEKIVYDRAISYLSDIEEYYDVEHRATEYVTFEMYAEGVESKPQCENSVWVNKKWVRNKDRDLSCVLFLSEYNDHIPFDSDYEVYGGKLEFPQYNFSFNPHRGTAIFFPSDPHFINAVSDIVSGDLYLARFHFATQMPFLYNPSLFPGSFTDWFKGDIG